MLSTLLPRKEAEEKITAFYKGVQKLADEAGVDCWVFGMEFWALNDKGKREQFLTSSGNGSFPAVVALSAWLYGRERGRFEKFLTGYKNFGLTEVLEEDPKES